jgi:mRNA-degrading endonuclease RelE of RelBE toxin-antitoxin system
MIAITVPDNWRRGEYEVTASSAQAKSEWDSFVASIPKAMQAAFERLSEAPLTAYGSRQFPLKGKQNKPFWEYELTGGDRLYYAVDPQKHVVVVCVLKHSTNSSSMTRTVQARRSEFDAIVVEQTAQKVREATALTNQLTEKIKRRK